MVTAIKATLPNELPEKTRNASMQQYYLQGVVLMVCIPTNKEFRKTRNACIEPIFSCRKGVHVSQPKFGNTGNASSGSAGLPLPLALIFLVRRI
jgi:hypothetical protein